MKPSLRRKTFHSLDRFTSEVCEYLDFDPVHWDPEIPEGPLSVQGCGYSIAAAFFGKGTTVLRSAMKDGGITIDSNAGEVTVQASVCINDLYTELSKKRLTIGAMPSFPGVTIGGCIAANVHGQNHYREGCFGNNVKRMKLFHPRKGMFGVSRNQTPDLFDLTVGGFGVTGVILEATLCVKALPTNVMDVTVRPFKSLLESHEIFMQEKDQYDYFHGWCDLANRRPASERGFLAMAKFQPGVAFEDEVPKERMKRDPLWGMPLNIFGTPLIKPINKAYYLLGTRTKKYVKTLSNFIFPSSGRMFYFNMFGKCGLIEHQVLIPHQKVEAYLPALRQILNSESPLVSLCHMKLFKGSRRHLNFNGDGFCLAMHFPNDRRTHSALRKIDALNNASSCITNLIKDSRLMKAEIAQQYPGLGSFTEAVTAFDPELTFRNTLTQKIFEGEV